jgi:TolB protein
MELGAKYSADGSSFIASRTVGRESDIVLFNSDGAVLRGLTRANGAIDVSPDWSPDQSKVVFVSNRGGGPQIYVMDANGGNTQRVSFVTSTYCTSPDWAPRGDKIAFVCLAEGRNQLFVANSDGTQPLQLTTYGSNEDPSWSPDGRYIVFATTFGQGRTYNLAIVRLDGSNMRQLTYFKSDALDPAWGPPLK